MVLTSQNVSYLTNVCRYSYRVSFSSDFRQNWNMSTKCSKKR